MTEFIIPIPLTPVFPDYDQAKKNFTITSE